jgi:hypothetical protein
VLQKLDFARAGAQKQCKVSLISPKLYGQWRCRNSGAHALQETNDGGLLTERLLQLVWHHQRLLGDQLQTLDGRKLKVLHPGFWNHEAGPDFRDALIQIEDAPVRQGDIEIDLHPSGWRNHKHDLNPAYQKVILHVVWDAESQGACDSPTLRLKPFLDAPLHELSVGLGRIPEELAAPLKGQCCAPLADAPSALFLEILHQASQIRLQAKAAHFQARARQAGWEQSLWEGLFGALGYKHNVWPMRRVAELLPVLTTKQEEPDSAFALQVRLLGVSGILPGELTRSRSTVDGYLRRVWDVWWRQQERYSDLVLPRELWRFNGLRPANHPQRRLALAAHWLAAGDLLAKLEAWFLAPFNDNALLPSLLTALQVQHDEFWSWHWTFRSTKMPKPQPLLGPQRITDLAVNVILPWFWMRAVAGKNDSLRQIAEHRYFAWPKAEDNSVLRLARQRLFGGKNARSLKTAAHQQGLLQIVRDFCDHSNALCDNCEFPAFVRQLKI